MKPLSIWLCATLLLMAWATTAPAKIIYVDDTAPGASNGTSWFNAYVFLQDALAAATAGDTIRVAQGTYRPNQATGPVDSTRTATFELINGVALLGGFAGYGSFTPDARMIYQYESILSGDLNGDDIYVAPDGWNEDDLLSEPTRQDNAYTVVTSDRNDASAILSGFTVYGGNANGGSAWPYQEVRGGGMVIFSGSPTIENCTFDLNFALDGGGALYNNGNAVSITGCDFTNNFSEEYGAGVHNNSVSQTEISGCSFSDNRAHSHAEGGAIYNIDSDIVIHGCSFFDNDGGSWGGGVYSFGGDVVIADCLFSGNTAWSGGGAIHNSDDTYANVEDCEFYNNETRGEGGALHNLYCVATAVNCIFKGNDASSEDGGGAIHTRGSDAKYINCVMSGNSADDKGGAMSVFESDVEIINCTFAGNASPAGTSLSTHFWDIGPSHVKIRNSILWDGPNCIYNDDGSLIELSYSNTSCPATGPGVIHMNPLFVNPVGHDGKAGTKDDNLRLHANSPSIDAGENFAVPFNITTDLDGKSRFQDNPLVFDTGNGTPPIVDMGAYEYGSSTTPPPPGGNRAPIANAGADQTVYTSVNGMASVTLNGSASYDPDGDSLNYSWNWVIGGVPYNANGVNPTISLPLGQHVINLVVGDGTLISAPDQVVINVVTSLDSQLWLYPYTLQKGNCGSSYVIAMVRLFGIQEHQVDVATPMTINPVGVRSYYQYTFETNDGTVMTTIVGLFDKAQLTATLPVNTMSDLTVVGKLKSGQSFQGTDKIMVTHCP